jgi:hypothetical protein
MSELEIVTKIKKLSVGRSFKVHTPTERQYALDAARINGLRVATRAIKNNGGFTVTRLPS